MEDDICFCHLLECCSVQTVERSVQGGESSHHSDSLTIRGHIAIEVTGHRDSSQKQLCATIFCRCGSSDLTKEIQPAGQPGDLGHPFRWGKVFAGEV